ncbi:MAG TPA: hypothetical protein VHF47_06610 [Acidimicrobiales bacterium]|nr:hypothetical protein [Acidimicrobiales bacterium]
MRRRLSALLTAALAASTLAVLGSAQPASAADVCAGAGLASISGAGLFYPGVGTTTTTSGTAGGSLTLYTLPRLESFAFDSSIAGACALGSPAVAAGGLVSGWCGHSWGSGATATGTPFSWVSAGSLLIISGGLTGVVNATPNVPAGASCATGALSFIVAGGVVVTNCGVVNNEAVNQLPVTTPDPIHTTSHTVGGTTASVTIAGGNYHVWHRVCAGT